MSGHAFDSLVIFAGCLACAFLIYCAMTWGQQFHPDQQDEEPRATVTPFPQERVRRTAIGEVLTDAQQKQILDAIARGRKGGAA